MTDEQLTAVLGDLWDEAQDTLEGVHMNDRIAAITRAKERLAAITPAGGPSREAVKVALEYAYLSGLRDNLYPTDLAVETLFKQGGSPAPSPKGQEAVFLTAHNRALIDIVTDYGAKVREARGADPDATETVNAILAWAKGQEAEGWNNEQLRHLVRLVWGYVDKHPLDPEPLGEPTDEAVDRLIWKASPATSPTRDEADPQQEGGGR